MSHHGQYDFGSPKLPSTPEAFMVYYLDDLDAKLNQVYAAIDNGSDDSRSVAEIPAKAGTMLGPTWDESPSSVVGDETRIYTKRIE